MRAHGPWVLAAALLLGIAADRLLWAGPIGPGLAIWIALLGGVAVFLAHRRRLSWRRATLGWVVVAVLAAGATAWRASPVLQLLFLGVLVLAAAAVLLEARDRPLWHTRVRDHAHGLLLVPWCGVLGAAPLLAGLELPAPPRRRRAVALGRGVLLAIPPVTIFALLFIAADPVFERMVGRLTTGLDAFPPHLFLTVGFGWIAAGLLAGVMPGSTDNPLDRLRPPRLGIEETAMVLGLVSALFAVFVALQFGYLFGGLAMLDAEEGLTLAAYARRGFFELVAVAGLVLALLLAVGASAPAGPGRLVFRSLAMLLVGLVMVVIASAALRLRLYMAEFGLTSARFYAAAVMAWLTVTLLFYAATALRDRPARFASGALIGALAIIALLAAANPDAVIARTNLDRATAHDVDTAYLAGLSADAVPHLVAGLDDLDPRTRCELSNAIRDRWAATPPADDWRTWNAARARARVAAERLRACGT